MAKDLNKVQLIGRLGKDVDSKFTANGKAVTTFSIATSGGSKDNPVTEWHNIVAWEKLAEIARDYLAKGSRIYVEGRLTTRSWDDKESGQKRYKTEIVATDIIMLDSKRDGDSEGSAPSTPRGKNAPVDISEDLPF